MIRGGASARPRAHAASAASIAIDRARIREYNAAAADVSDRRFLDAPVRGGRHAEAADERAPHALLVAEPAGIGDPLDPGVAALELAARGLDAKIDVISGGSIDGVLAALDRILALATDATKIIPGHGPLATKRDLATYRDMLRTIRERVAEGIAAGQTLAQVQAARPTREWDAAFDGGFVSGARLTEYVYTSLTKR